MTGRTRLDNTLQSIDRWIGRLANVGRLICVPDILTIIWRLDTALRNNATVDTKKALCLFKVVQSDKLAHTYRLRQHVRIEHTCEYATYIYNIPLLQSLGPELTVSNILKSSSPASSPDSIKNGRPYPNNPQIRRRRHRHSQRRPPSNRLPASTRTSFVRTPASLKPR